jgi:putative restriction endonuclease
MQYEELKDKFLKVHVFESQGQRAPHKPLLLLLSLGRLINGKPRLTSYREIEPVLRDLLVQFGLPSKVVHPEYPFWWLQTDGLWEVFADGELQPRKGHKDPKKSELLVKNARGGFPETIHNRLLKDRGQAIDIAIQVVEHSFPSSLREDILEAVGIDASDADAAPTIQRDPKFRTLVLEAYQYACCICGLKLQIGTSVFGVEAAHIKWHQAGGPSTVTNGLALCLIHHRAFDRGAISITKDNRVALAKALHGNSSYDTLFEQFYDKPVQLPRDQADRPAQHFVDWHWHEVFRSSKRRSQS